MRTLPSAAALAAAALLAGCGGSASSTGAQSSGAPAASMSPSAATAPSPSASAAPGRAGQSAKDLVTAARTALASAPSVRIAGRATQNGETTRIDLHLVRGRGATGTITVKGGALDVVRIGSVAYIKGDSRFWTANAGSAEAKVLADKWIKVRSSSSSFASFLEFTDLATFAKEVTKPTGTLRKGSVRSVGGSRGIELTDGEGVLVVALDGKAYPLFVGPQAETGGEGFTFSDYGRPVALKAPAGPVVDVPLP